MKHAGKEALSKLQTVLEDLRGHSILRERTPGSFYLRSSGFVHFHEDPAGLFGDLKEDLVSFTRHRVTSRTEQRQFLERVRRTLERASIKAKGK
jgi:hypothetical protein